MTEKANGISDSMCSGDLAHLVTYASLCVATLVVYNKGIPVLEKHKR